MSVVGKVRKNAVYKPTDLNQDLRNSALALIRQLVAMTDVHEKHHREAISLALWKWTEAFGVAPHAKYNIRYVSRGVMEGAPDDKVNHEHVFPRKWLVARLMKIEPASHEFEAFLDENGAACIVTMEEHGALGAARGTGWERYVGAGVDVYDRLHRQYVEPAALAAGGEVGDVPQPLPETQDSEYEEDITASPRHDGSVTDDIHRFAAVERIPVLLRLARSAHLALGVTVRQRSKNAPTYFRVHDAVIEEPTRTAAYVNFNGTVDLALKYDDLPDRLRLDCVEPRPENRGAYGVRCRLSDDASLAAAEELISLALERIRDDHAGWTPVWQ
jgi:hypothetical protein